jgi:hypothetical protein
MTLKPWREIAVPHEDVLKGTFQQAEFAADLSRVHDGSATPEYQNPALFFQRTFITEGMRLLLGSVVKRLSGQGGDPVIQLQTAFGGGKTHTMLAVYHLAQGKTPARDLHGISPILDSAGISELPTARIVVLDGNKLSPNQPKKRGSLDVHTMWGELAWQLGGAAAYEQVRDSDIVGTSPGKEILARLLAGHAPCVILIDDLVAYLRQFDEGKRYTGGSYDSNLSFVQALTEALKAVPNAILLASLPESDKEAGSQKGINALAALSHYFGRVQALWKPVATEEAFEIVRRRLFATISDRAAADQVCRAFADLYVANATDLPQETQESHYYERLQRAYPIHPEIFARLYEDWSSLDNFQRTRGVLKLMARVIHRLWQDGDKDLLILPGSLPLYDADTRNEVIYYLPQGWDPVLERDIDGERAETTDIENRDVRLGSVQACRRTARTIFLGSAPSAPNQLVRGLEENRILLGCLQPGQQPGVFKDALRRLADRLHYLNSANSRCWFDTRPNLRREMEERKRRFQEKDDILPAIRSRVQQSLGNGLFGGVHVFTPSGDIPDDGALRLVVLPTDAPFSKTGHTQAQERASEILKSRGDQPRQRQNRLLFLAADNDTVSRLKDQVRSVLAWQSIVADSKELKLNLDQYQSRQAERSLAEANDALKRMVRETYKWLLAPMQEARAGAISAVKWEYFTVNPGAQIFIQEIERVMKENELVIGEWAPIHLAKILKDWFWKDAASDVIALDVWQKMCCYLYLPRLKEEGAFRNAIAAGSGSKDFFGLAYGKEGGRYVGASLGQAVLPIMDTALLLVKPEAVPVEEPPVVPEPAASTGNYPDNPRIADPPTGKEGAGTAPTTVPRRKRFYAGIDLDPVRAKTQFNNLIDEVVLQFSAKAGTRVRITIDIEAENDAGFDDGLQRAVKENCNTLRFKIAQFEE